MKRGQRSNRADKGLKLVLERMSSRYAIAKALNLNTSTVQRWKRIPYQHLVEIERITGISRAQLASDDLFAGWQPVKRRKIKNSGTASYKQAESAR